MLRLGGMRKKGLALLLSIIMVLGLFPLSALADELAPTDAAAAPEVIVSPTPATTEAPTVAPTEAPTAAPTEEVTAAPSESAEAAEAPAASEEPAEAPAETAEASEAPEEAEAIEDPAVTGEPAATEEPAFSPEPTPMPEPDFLFTQDTVFLSEILEAVDLTVDYNATLSVDSDLIRLSDTHVETVRLDALNLEQITLTATDLFAFATLTVTDEKTFAVQTVTMAYPKRPLPTPAPAGEPDETEEPVETETPAVTEAPIDAVLQSETDRPTEDPLGEAGRPVPAEFDRPDIAGLDPAQLDALSERTVLFDTDGSTYEIRVAYDRHAGIPAGAKLLAVPLNPDDADYEAYVTAAAKKLGYGRNEFSVAGAFDIKIVDGEDSSVIYEPDGTVEVSIRLINTDLARFDRVNVLHFTESRRSAALSSDALSSIVTGETVSFTTDGFSVYIVVGHEEETVNTPRIIFHFIDDGATELQSGNVVYYEGEPYCFTNKNSDSQTTQILKNGESLELFNDPGNKPIDPSDPSAGNKFFFGWYVVNPKTISGTTDDYGIGTSAGHENHLFYTLPQYLDTVNFEVPISITESDVDIGDTVHWSIGSTSGSCTVDASGNAHVFLIPVYENYHFVNFLLEAKNTNVATNSVMTRKMITLGTASDVDVKISDIHSTSRDPVHLVFTGWEYYDTVNSRWVQVQTVDHEGNTLHDANHADGVYMTVDISNITNVNLYPIFVEARWVDFNTGGSKNGANYVASCFVESWGVATPAGTKEEADKNVFTQLDVPTRPGYTFGGWYAFAEMNQNTAEITNLTTAAAIDVSYINVANKFEQFTTTINTTAVKITNGDGTIYYNGDYTLGSTGQTLFSGYTVNDPTSPENGEHVLKLLDPLDRLSLCACWIPDNTDITIVYWTENAENSSYTASAARTVSTTALSSTLSQSITSGYRFTLTDFKWFEELSHNPGSQTALSDLRLEYYLSEAGAVPADEEMFFELNETLSDAQQTIMGDGSTLFNVYYKRREFTLVFHIGHDGYVKNAGQMKNNSYPNWDGNWIEYMYKDAAVTALGYTGRGSTSYVGACSMTYTGGTPSDPSDDVTATSAYVTSNASVMGDYLPTAGEDLYVIKAKYGAYIGDRWPSPTNPNFTWTEETDPGKTGYQKSLYVWTAYYGSLYAGIANNRPTTGGNTNGNNSDINGVYEYMSAELCANRAGTGLINDNQVHHLVAYFGDTTNSAAPKRFKQYHVLIEAVAGTIYDPSNVSTVSGDSYAQYNRTTWSEQNSATSGLLSGKEYYELRSELVISNLEPQYQLGWDLDGYTLVYSCYDPVQYPDPNVPGQKDYDVFFFYRPLQYTLTFKFEDVADRHSEQYYYTQSLADAMTYAGYQDPSRTGFEFFGWYTNEAGIGDPFDFGTEIMPCANVVLYPILKVLQYRVDIDPNGGVIDHINYDKPGDDYYGITASDYGVTTGYQNNSTGHDIAQATYFTADYGTPIGAYTVEREYILLSEKELTTGDPLYYSGDKYYYVNTQFNAATDGDWGLPPDLRNALYLTAAQLHSYYLYYEAVATANQSYYTGVTVLSEAAFQSTFTSYPDHPYRRVSGEHYTFVGWFRDRNGTVDTMPYNFNDPVTENIKLVAKWRLDGGYYVQYNPYYYAEDGNGGVTAILGEMTDWTDPTNPSDEHYTDQSYTQILQAPTNVTPNWVFRGWRVVKNNGTKSYTEGGVTRTYIDWAPIQLDSNNEPIYYQPGDVFLIDSDLVTDTTANGGVIFMQAYYEPEAGSSRRTEYTNLTLDANITYGNGHVSTSYTLPALSGPGVTEINTADHLNGGLPSQILFKNFQSNIALHLYQYATNKTYRGTQGNKFFVSGDGYLLIGFDPQADPENPSTHHAFIPAIAPDSVIAVQRTDNELLYAMWEPMLYVTFVNDTDEAITIRLSGSGTDTVSIVNAVTGEFDRAALTSTVTVPANSSIKIVLPDAVANQTFTATAQNDHAGKLMSVNGAFGAADPYGTGCADVPVGYDLNYTGALASDATGIVVTYTETDVPKPRVFFDMNGGTVWNETDSHYSDLTGLNVLYALEKADIPSSQYPPADPSRTGKVFVGWTTYATIATHTDFSSTNPVYWGETITPDAGGNVLEKIKSDYLFDFNQALSPDGDLTLYAVWSDTVTVTFDMTYTGGAYHTWGGPAVGTNGFVASGNNVTYTLAKGDRVPKPVDPTANANLSGYFFKWLIGNNTTDPLRSTLISTSNSNADKANFITYNSYAFDFSAPVTADVRLVTSWLANQPQVFTFTIENRVVNGFSPDDEFTYTIAVSGEKMNSKGKEKDPTQRWGSVTTTLKDGETYTVLVKVSYIYPGWHGYCTTIDVIDRDGAVVKSQNVMVHTEQSYSGYTSDYMYTLTVTQAAATGYETDVAIVSSELTGDSVNNVSSYYTVPVIFRTTTTSNFNSFEPQQNGYVPGQAKSIHVRFTNTNPETTAKLTITKTVTGNSADLTKDFTFTLTSVEDETTGTNYNWEKTAGGVVTAGQIQTGQTFTLKHGEVIFIKVPLNKQVVITETSEVGYTTTWRFGSNAVTAGNAATVTLTGNTTLAFTNTFHLVSPTGVSWDFVPFAVVLLLGGMLLVPVILYRRRRRKEA